MKVKKKKKKKREREETRLASCVFAACKGGPQAAPLAANRGEYS